MKIDVIQLRYNITKNEHKLTLYSPVKKKRRKKLALYSCNFERAVLFNTNINHTNCRRSIFYPMKKILLIKITEAED